MRRRLHQPTRIGILVAFGIVIAAHVLATRYAFSHLAVPGALAIGVVVLVLVKHVGAAALLGPLYRRVRRRL
jgi:hypothetical protein